MPATPIKQGLKKIQGRKTFKMIPVCQPYLNGNELKYVEDAVRTGWISSSGKYVRAFEEAFAQYCGVKHAVAVCNGTVALHLALVCLGIGKGDEVIVPNFTMIASAIAVCYTGATPVFVDADPATWNIDARKIEEKITPRTKAVMPVHIFGNPCAMQAISALARKHNLLIIEDAAEAHGAECLVDGKWRRCGSFGEVSAFSFYANKNITTGEGGMVLTDDSLLARKLQSRRNLCFGAKERFLHEDRGWNYRMTNVQAAMGCAQLEQIERFIARKLEMADLYNAGLHGLPLQLPHVKPWARTSVWMYAVVLEDSVLFDAPEFARRLMEKGIQTRPFFMGMHEQPVYRRLGLFKGCNLPVTERIARRGLYLPSGQAITNEQIANVVKSVIKVLT